MIDAATLREWLHYDPDTGNFTWLRGQCAGRRAGSPNNTGHISIWVLGRLYKAHRLAFLYMTGEWPSKDVDHINVNPGDNSWGNLREATQSQNCANKPPSAANTSGLKGVHWKTANKKWCAQIKVRGRKQHLGLFDTAEEAHARYCAAVKENFGEFGRVA